MKKLYPVLLAIFFLSTVTALSIIAQHNQYWTKETKRYTNQDAKFTFEYPKYLTPNEEYPSGINFSSQEGPWDFMISAVPTDFTSVDAFVSDAPQATKDSTGFEQILRIQGNPEFILVAEHTYIEQSQEPPFAKHLLAFAVENGTLYRFTFRHLVSPEELPALSSELLSVLQSFSILP